MNFKSDWFIAPRVRRLHRMFCVFTKCSSGIHRSQLLSELKKTIDGPRHEIPMLIDILLQIGLVDLKSNNLQLSRFGVRFANQPLVQSRIVIAKLLLQRGYFHDQLRKFMETSTVEEKYVQCRVAFLKQSAPQLLGVLKAWPGFIGPSLVRIPSEVYTEITAPWSLIPLAETNEESRKAVGWRAEAYSYHFLRSLSSRPTTIAWVSKDDQSLGYDIEDRSSDVMQRVEVKGSRGNEVRFLLSANEHKVAHQNPDTYAIHFWAKINLDQNPNEEFHTLVHQGYPLVFHNLATHLADNALVAVPSQYKVTEGSGAVDVN